MRMRRNISFKARGGILSNCRLMPSQRGPFSATCQRLRLTICLWISASCGLSRRRNLSSFGDTRRSYAETCRNGISYSAGFCRCPLERPSSSWAARRDREDAASRGDSGVQNSSVSLLSTWKSIRSDLVERASCIWLSITIRSMSNNSSQTIHSRPMPTNTPTVTKADSINKKNNNNV